MIVLTLIMVFMLLLFLAVLIIPIVLEQGMECYKLIKKWKKLREEEKKEGGNEWD